MKEKKVWKNCIPLTGRIGLSQIGGPWIWPPGDWGGGFEGCPSIGRSMYILPAWSRLYICILDVLSISCKPVVLNRVGGTEPHKFHTCIHRTLGSWKNKMCVMNFHFYCSKSLDSTNPSDSIKPRGFGESVSGVRRQKILSNKNSRRTFYFFNYKGLHKCMYGTCGVQYLQQV